MITIKKLEKYNQKRNFNKTKEPQGKIEKGNKKLRFCIQHHLARRDHYDLRLEKNGVLVSWAVPKGPSYNPKDKRLAVHVEDHPLSYRNFEGTIPKGEYGGGTVMLWDHGYYEKIVWQKDIIKVIFHGKRIKGMWTLVLFKEDNWLLIKDEDYYANFCDIKIYNTSIKTNRTMKEIEQGIKKIRNKEAKDKVIIEYNEISNPDKVIFTKPKITKLDIINYYNTVAKRMIPYLENRLISVIRCPEGLNGEKFFKKHLENKSTGIGKVRIPSKEKSDYYYIKDTVGLISEVQMNSFEFHIWGSLASDRNKPNMLVFDLDPDQGLSLDKIREGVKDLKSILDSLNLKSFLKTSGGKGYHVVVPTPKMSWKNFSKTAEDIAKLMVAKWPNKYTTNMREEKRKGKIFIDWFRNKKGATSVAPYSIRLRDNAPVSMPISWKELDTVKPNEITMKEAIKRIKKKDPWAHFFD